MSLGARLHITFGPGTEKATFSLPRRYTLTHSDLTGEFFLTIAREYNRKQVSGWYTRLMRDEVLAEWSQEGGKPSLRLYCHVSGGIVFGSAKMRYGIFQKHMSLVLQAFHEGDRTLFEQDTKLRDAQAVVQFDARQARFRKTEEWGKIGEY